MSDDGFWKKKLLAYLHDPPHKPRAIAAHEDQRGSFLNRLGLDSGALHDFDPSNDWQAAAADRLVFPDPAKSGLRVDWASNDFEFRHPLGGGRLTPKQFPTTAAVMEEAFVSALDGLAPESDDWKLKFIRTWRLWPERSAREKAAHLAYVVADTRIPDHTLWHHNGLAAAFTAAGSKPAFLLFQIGPVQEFIAQARTTRDLWSASYLLSFLIAQGMLAIAEQIGPDAIMFPQLRGMPLADFHWSASYFGGNRLRASRPEELLTPNLPNRFLALVPADWKDGGGKSLANLALERIRDTWREIATSVHRFISQQMNGSCPGWDKHWHKQVDRFPVVDWVVHPWTDATTALNDANGATPPLHGGWENHPLRHACWWATECIPGKERENFGPLSNSGFFWALHYAVTDWKFAARKSARAFAPWRAAGHLESDGVPKDHLDGKNEALGGAGHERFWEVLRQKLPKDFKGSQVYGALTVIKRLWADHYLSEYFDLDRAKPVFQPVDEIAQIDEKIDAEGEEAEKPYYAVIAMDGDDLGRWLSGVKAAPLVNSLAEKAQAYFREHWPKGEQAWPAADEVPRPLSPGYHASLSEALANFSLFCARRIVEEFRGQLIYAGGDDVLAMTPAGAALDCAQALQLCFRGVHPDDMEAHASAAVKKVLNAIFDYSRHVDGFVSLRRSERKDVGRAERLKPNWPLMVMGPKATASVGIAIGHVRSPMQDTIQAARDAEKTAKDVPDKGAFCLRILKRSGEAVGFSARWNGGAVAVWGELNAEVHNLSGRFAYRYAELVKALVVEGGGDSGAKYPETWDLEVAEAVQAELRHVLQQQGGVKPEKAGKLAAQWLAALVPALGPRDFLHFWLAWAFVHRQSQSETANQP